MKESKIYTYQYPRPSVAVDLILFGIQDGKLCVLVGQRSAAPHKGRWCFPGTYVRENESAAEACDRKIKMVGLEHSYLEQLFTFTDPKRDPRERVVTIAHYGLIPIPRDVPAGDEKIGKLEWAPVVDVMKREMAFDHEDILGVAVERLRSKIQYAPISPRFTVSDFTLTELANIYSAILGREIDLSNFRRDLLKQHLVVPVGTRAVRGPLAKTYRWNWENKKAFFLSLGN